MRQIKAQKTTTQGMLEVTSSELKSLVTLNPWIAIGQHDLENTDFNSENIIGYVAGDIDQLTFKSGAKKPINEASDVWFINKNFFDKNYREIGC